ncbi:hypothetical protein [Streptomyces sp. NPDC006285]|uniref:hypothetical protein n=1 Tax=Streptomyces sp. NPDC006285 TaxID=3364742 RepID=UPI0036B7622D
MTLGGYEGVTLGAALADRSFVTPAVPDDGHDALLVGGIGGGGLIGLVIPLILFAAVRGTEEKPRLRPGEALIKALATLAIGCYLLAVSLLSAQLGWIFPQRTTTVLSVFAVGFSWAPLALFPWERFGRILG